MKQLKKTILAISFFASLAALAQSGESAFKPVYISKVPKPVAPASLVVSDISFSDADGNQNKILDANESAGISFRIKNTGKGDAYSLVITSVVSGKSNGIKFQSEEGIGTIAAGGERTVNIPLQSDMQLESGQVTFSITVKEGNGFDSDPFKITFSTQRFRDPKLVIADYFFSNNEAEGKIRLGQTVSLKMIVQNQGQGDARNVKVKFKNPLNVFPANMSEFELNNLRPNDSKTIVYEFFANKQYSPSEIPITAEISESHGKYGLTQEVKVSLEQSLAQTSEVNVRATSEPTVKISELSLLPDVDKNIPLNEDKKENRFALIIGNENYSSFQSGLSTEANVDYARNDARIFKLYSMNTLGIPDENITFLADATAAQMRQAIDKMNKLIKNSGGNAEVIVYYAGHGLPDEKNKDAYLIPVDVSGNDLQAAVPLASLYASLSEFPAARITVFLDACFSGGGRNKDLIASRSVKVKPRAELPKGRMVVFAASSGDQVSLPYNEKQHGMFTYFLLKALQESKGAMSYNDLAIYLAGHVGLESVKINSKEQNPQISFSEEIRNEFEKWKMD
jgi:hypothetical protein